MNKNLFRYMFSIACMSAISYKPIHYIFLENSFDFLYLKNDVRQESSIYIEEEDGLNDYGTVSKYANIMIRNHTDYEIDVKKLKDDKLGINVKYNNPKVFIYHTHTSEAYKMDKNNQYIETEKYRTINLDYSVAGVGKELITELNKYGINAIQSETIHDYPEYTGAYDRSYETANYFLKNNVDVPIVIDLHRDATAEDGNNFRPVVNINGNQVARLMLVVGTDANGLEHTDWMENLKLAIKIQDIGNRMYPGLFREIDVRKERFNQNLSRGAIIVEVGGTGNTISEAKESMKYFASVINKLCGD